MRKADHNYALARRLRRNLSLPEGLLWRELRRQSGGIRIRRQHPVGPYVIDFYCAAAKLAIEIDGIAHDMADRPDHDTKRDEFLRGQGIETVRIAAREVLASPLLVAESIVSACRARGA